MAIQHVCKRFLSSLGGPKFPVHAHVVKRECLSNCYRIVLSLQNAGTNQKRWMKRMDPNGLQWTPVASGSLAANGNSQAAKRKPLLNICLLCLYIVFRRVLQFQTSTFSKLDYMLEVRLASTPPIPHVSPDLCLCFFLFSGHTSDAGDMSTAWEFLDEICRFSQRQASGPHLLGGGW